MRTYDPLATRRRVVSPRTGLVRRLQLLPRRPGGLGGPYALAPMAHLGVLPAGGDILANGGNGLGIAEAADRALHEAVERYCGAFCDPAGLVRARPSETDAPEAFLCGPRLPLFSETQYAEPRWPWRRLTVDSDVHWVAGRSLHTGRLGYVPAVLVYVPYRLLAPDEVLAPSTSSGMACAPTFSGACLAGLLEVCERDAFMGTWLHRLSRPRLAVPRGGALAREVDALLAGRAARVTFVDLTNDLAVPVVLAVLEARWRGQRTLNVGTAARPRYEDAARKALLEAISDYHRVCDARAANGDAWRPEPDFANVVDFEWHSLAYVTPELQRALEFLTASPGERPMGGPHELGARAPEELLRDVLARMARAGEEAFVVPLTTRDVAELGLEVVKVVVPRAVPLYPDHRFPLLGSPRLYALPRILGLRAGDVSAAELNLAIPHPFA